MTKLKPIPEFKSEEEEFEFWSTCDFTEYLDPEGWVRHSSSEANSQAFVALRLPPEMEKALDRLSREKKMTIEEMVRQLVAAGLKQQGIQPQS
jgi:hypothetical protein